MHLCSPQSYHLTLLHCHSIFDARERTPLSPVSLWADLFCIGSRENGEETDWSDNKQSSQAYHLFHECAYSENLQISTETLIAACPL